MVQSIAYAPIPNRPALSDEIQPVVGARLSPLNVEDTATRISPPGSTPPSPRFDVEGGLANPLGVARADRVCRALGVTAAGVGGLMVGMAAGAMLGGFVGGLGEFTMSAPRHEGPNPNPNASIAESPELMAWMGLMALRFAQVDTAIGGFAGMLMGAGHALGDGLAGEGMATAGKALALICGGAQAGYLAGGWVLGGLTTVIAGVGALLFQAGNANAVCASTWYYSSHIAGVLTGLVGAGAALFYEDCDNYI